MNITDLFTFLGEKGNIALAGAAGGLVRWLTLRSSLTDGVVAIIVGCLSALYLGPLAEPAITLLIGDVIIDPLARSSFSGFILGLGGISISGFVMDFWQAKRNGNSKGEK